MPKLGPSRRLMYVWVFGCVFQGRHVSEITVRSKPLDCVSHSSLHLERHSFELRAEEQDSSGTGRVGLFLRWFGIWSGCLLEGVLGAPNKEETHQSRDVNPSCEPIRRMNTRTYISVMNYLKWPKRRCTMILVRFSVFI